MFTCGRALTWRRQWHPTPVFLTGKSHGWRSLVGFSPWGREESDTTERLHFHFSLSCIGEGNGNPLQCSCLENPRDGGAWGAAVYGVAESQTRLKRLSSSSSSSRALTQVCLILSVSVSNWVAYCKSQSRNIVIAFDKYCYIASKGSYWYKMPVYQFLNSMLLSEYV